MTAKFGLPMDNVAKLHGASRGYIIAGACWRCRISLAG
jgi:hypothetical protein